MSKLRKKFEELHFSKKEPLSLLKPLSTLYGSIMRLRREMYNRNILRRERTGCLTISVGNLTYGGTGKTPVVINLADMLSKRGFRIGIIHSGYGSSQHRKKRARRVTDYKEGVELGDEAAELFVRGKDALVYSCRNRIDAIERAIQEGGVNVCILDDAFQYLKIEADINILVVDPLEPFGNEHCLPAGPMREPKDAVKYADLIWFVTHREFKKDPSLEREFLSINNSLKFVYSRLRPDPIIHASDGRTIEPSGIDGVVVSFAGIGRDHRFIEMLRACNIKTSEHISFSDHHRYTMKDIKLINDMAKRHKAKYVITTEKDYLRDTFVMAHIPNLYILRVFLEITDGNDELERLCGSLAQD
jgi:tetraacyldisaccharide 4'-kinase